MTDNFIPEFERSVLPNGLALQVSHWPNRPWEAVGFVIHCGGADDPLGQEGLAHFVEHLVSENNGFSNKRIQEFFEDHGGQVGLGETSYLYTAYKFFVPAQKKILTKAFKMFGEMLLCAKFKKFIERERSVIKNEFQRDFPLKSRYEFDLQVKKDFLKGTWFERSLCPLGTPEAIKNISALNLQEFYDRYYAPANITIVAIGGLDTVEITELLTASPFGGSKPGQHNPSPVPIKKITKPRKKHYVFNLGEIFQDAAIDLAGYQAFAKIPAKIKPAALTIACRMLNYLLFKEIREKRGWAYGIEAEFFAYQICHILDINCHGLKSEAIDSFGDVVDKVIASLANKKHLFEQIKRRILAEKTMLDVTGRDLLDEVIGMVGTWQKLGTFKEDRQEIEAVSFADILKILSWLEPEKRVVILTRL